jgi:hypothetical protein
MSFLKKLFGLGGSSASKEPDPASAPSQEHEGYTIRATPYEEGGRFQLCGVISKEIDGEMKEHRFIRADKLATMEDAVSMTFFKGRQIIDQMGEDLFRHG